MAHEVSDWKQSNCSLTVNVGDLTKREPFAREINDMYGEGGALNANYQTVEAIAIVASLLGACGLVYGLDYKFKTGGGNIVRFDFTDRPTMNSAMAAIAELRKNNQG